MNNVKTNLKRIVCFGDSNTWGFNALDESRFDENTRWTKLLNKTLGSEYEIIEEGLSGRTAASDDPITEGLNSLSYIHPCLNSHRPLHLLIIMLGTNDAKERLSLTSLNIAQSILRLAKKAETTLKDGHNYPVKILVVSPPPIEQGYYGVTGDSMGKGCHEKTNALGENLKSLLKDTDFEFLDLKGKVSMSAPDYTHLNKEGHKLVAKHIYEKIKPFI